jgi:hypothetical protein
MRNGCHCKCCGRNGANYCKALHIKTLFNALYGTYAVTLHELKAVLNASILTGQTNSPKASGQENNAGGWFSGSTEVEAARHRRNRRNFKESESADQNFAHLKRPPPPKEVVTQNFFAPLRAADMDTESSGTEATSNEAVPGKIGRQPPIILTATTNLIQLQKELRNVVKESFEFRALEPEP